MKKSAFIIIVVLLGIVGIWLGQTKALQIVPPSAHFTNPTPSTEVESGANEQYFPPVKVSISKINVKAQIEPVGQDAQGRMDVPKASQNAAWYQPGFKVGEKGNMVLAGHFDTVTGTPAVFYNLDKLEIGDEIIVTDTNGKEWKYKVADKKVFDFDKLPLEQIFGVSDSRNLNLITCDGVFDQNTKNYSKRLVVYAKAP